MNILSELNARGHLTIHKIQGGQEELIHDDANIIVSGMGWSLSHFFARLGSQSIPDYQIDRFQIGVSGTLANQVSGTYELSGHLSSVAEYTGNGDSNILSFSGHQWKNSVINTVDINSNEIFYGSIPFGKVTRIDDTSVRYSIFIDEDSCNSISREGVDANLNEIGLFIKNPWASIPESSILVAYKYFSNIRKTSDFGLLFRWTISFG